MRVSLFICTLLFAASSVNGFVTKSTVQNSLGLATSNRSNNAPHLPTPSSSSSSKRQQQQVALTVQQMANKPSYDDGQDRGKVIQTQLRRSHFCPTTVCVENRASCSDCVTFGEWKGKVADYYKGGGGVNFDFSIDPATKESNKEMMDAVLRR